MITAIEVPVASGSRMVTSVSNYNIGEDEQLEDTEYDSSNQRYDQNGNRIRKNGISIGGSKENRTFSGSQDCGLISRLDDRDLDSSSLLDWCPDASDQISKQRNKFMRNLSGSMREQQQQLTTTTTIHNLASARLTEKSVIIHRDDNGFGLRVKGQNPVLVEHVHENGAAWRAGVRPGDRIGKVNGVQVTEAEHKDVVLMFKACARFIGLTILVQQPAKRHTPTADWSSLLAGDLPVDGEPVGGRRSSVAKQHLAMSKLQHNHHFHHSFNWADGRRPTGDSTMPMVPLPDANRQPQAGDRHQNSARRSESVAGQRPAGFCLNKQAATGPGSDRPEQTHEESETGNKRPAVNCPNCRSLNKQRLNCLQCQLISFRSAPDKTPPIGKHRLPPAAEHLRLRLLGGSMRDPKQTQQSPLEGRAGSVQSNSQQKSQQLKYSPASNKLKQSASSNSLNLMGGSKVESKPLVVPSIVLSKQQQQQQPQQQPAPAQAQQKPMTNKRLEIIREFIETERAHTDRLRCLDELFYRPLKAGGLMSAEQLRSVFSCHRTLYKIHRQIHRTLLSANHNLYAEPMIGSALLEIFEGDLKRKLERASCSFCSAQATNVDLLNKLTRRDTKVGEFIAQVTSQQMTGRLGIKDLLASCFQRLTKYPLLLESLLKATPQSLPPLPSQSSSATGSSSAKRKSPRRQLMDRHSEEDDDYEDEEEEEEEDGSCTKQSAQRSSDEEEDERLRQSRRMLAISLAEEREFIERALSQSRQILVKVNDSVKVSMSHQKLKDIWKRTDKYPGVPLIDITKQQVVHEGLLTLRLSKRSFDVYVLLLNDYLIILTREGQDKYRLKFFTPEGKSSSSALASAAAQASGASGGGQQLQLQSVYSPVFVIDEHLTTRDAATDENGFYLLCKRKDDSRIYEFASRSPAERMKWRDRIQWTIERQMSRAQRRGSCESTITKSSSELSSKQELDTLDTPLISGGKSLQLPGAKTPLGNSSSSPMDSSPSSTSGSDQQNKTNSSPSKTGDKIEGTISYVEDDGIVMPSKLGLSRPLVDQAVQVSIFNEASGFKQQSISTNTSSATTTTSTTVKSS